MSITARFIVQRQNTLEKAFDTKLLIRLWRDVIKKELRDSDIEDLHDYYDINQNINNFSTKIKTEVMDGHYKPRAPLIYKFEKKYGICRHMVLPNPSDALVLQAIFEVIHPLIQKKEPTKRALFSRNRHSAPNNPHEVVKYHGSSDPLNWLRLWKKFQQEILRFSDSYDYLVVTDLTNYYDNIGLRELRHVISSVEIPEVLLDLLFNIIELLSWVPDYLPSSLKGLPTANIEIFRLLAHAFLFEVDEILDQKTNNSFVRWMDDIDFGINTEHEAYTVLGSINDVLKSRGLALNISKTQIYRADEAKKHFLFEENVLLDKIQEEIKKASGTLSIHKKAWRIEIIKTLKKLLSSMEKSNYRNRDKIIKRILTASSQLDTSAFVSKASDLFFKNPGLRPNVVHYFRCLGPKKPVRNSVADLLKSTCQLDDVTKLYLAKLLTGWKMDRSKSSKQYIDKIKLHFMPPKGGMEVFEFYCNLWFLSKYGEDKELASVITTRKKLWRHNPFLSRQVIATLPRIYLNYNALCLELLDEQIAVGAEDVASVAAHTKQLLSIKTLTTDMRMYFFNPKQKEYYPLPKFLVLMSILQSKNLKDRKLVFGDANTQIQDPWYRHWIEMVE